MVDDYSATLFDAFQENARRAPHSIAWYQLHGPSLVSWTWSDLDRACVALAWDWKRKGIGPSNRVLSYLPNGLGWILVDAACAALGAVHIPIDRKRPHHGLVQDAKWLEADWIVEEAEPTSSLQGSIALSMSAHELDSSNVIDSPCEVWTWHRDDALDNPWDCCRIDPDWPANILITSGTSGVRKGVVLSHRNLMSNARAKLDAMPQFESDLRINLLSFAHAYARTCEFTTWILSRSMLASVASIDALWYWAPRLQPTLLNAVPKIYKDLQSMLENQKDDALHCIHQRLGNRIRMLASGGAGLPSGTALFFRHLGLPIHQGYGLTETSPVVCSQRSLVRSEAEWSYYRNHWSEWLERVRSSTLGEDIGPPVAGVECRVDRDQRLWVRGPNIMKGYWKDPERTQLRIREGWLDTGDVVETLSSGAMRMKGRSDDCIVLSTGRKVYPLDVENELLSHLDLHQVMVLGNEQDFVAALMVPRSSRTNLDSTTEDAIYQELDEMKWLQNIENVLSHRPKYERPQRVVLLASPFSEENGTLTSKGSLVRPRIQELFSDTIAKLFERQG